MGRKRKRDDPSSASSASSDSDDDAPQRTAKRVHLDEEKQGAGERARLANYNGYYAIPIGVVHTDLVKYLYVKEHQAKDDEYDAAKGRTLFVTNLAFDCTKEDLESIFSVFGPIESIKFDSFMKAEWKKMKEDGKGKKKAPVGDPNEHQRLILEERKRVQDEAQKVVEQMYKEPFERAGYAHVIFTDPEAIKKGFKKLSPQDFVGKVERGAKRGLSKYLSEYMKEAELDPAKLQQEVNQYMFDFDRSLIEHKKKIDELSTMPDADGWVTVTKKGKKKTEGAEGKKMGAASLSATDLQRLKAKAEEKKLTDFYRFQHSENRNKYVDSLRARFEEDKRRIERMKQNRRFRPD